MRRRGALKPYGEAQDIVCAKRVVPRMSFDRPSSRIVGRRSIFFDGTPKKGAITYAQTDFAISL